MVGVAVKTTIAENASRRAIKARIAATDVSGAGESGNVDDQFRSESPTASTGSENSD
jgi:hypothetical protein